MTVWNSELKHGNNAQSDSDKLVKDANVLAEGVTGAGEQARGDDRRAADGHVPGRSGQLDAGGHGARARGDGQRGRGGDGVGVVVDGDDGGRRADGDQRGNDGGGRGDLAVVVLGALGRRRVVRRAADWGRRAGLGAAGGG